MKTSTLDRLLPAGKNFHDFSMFSVFIVRRGDIFTPRDKDRKRRTRVAPLRRPTLRPGLSAWDRRQVIYVKNSRIAEQAKKADEVARTEDEQWAAVARLTRLSWMEENPY